MEKIFKEFEDFFVQWFIEKNMSTDEIEKMEIPMLEALKQYHDEYKEKGYVSFRKEPHLHIGVSFKHFKYGDMVGTRFQEYNIESDKESVCAKVYMGKE